MSFADEVRANGRKAGTACTIAIALDTLDPDMQAEVAAVISSPAYTSSAIVRALKSRGVEVSEQAMSRHRREGCRCSRTT